MYEQYALITTDLLSSLTLFNLSSRVLSSNFPQDLVTWPFFQFPKQNWVWNVSFILIWQRILSSLSHHSLTSWNSTSTVTFSSSTIHKATFIQLHCTSTSADILFDIPCYLSVPLHSGLISTPLRLLSCCRLLGNSIASQSNSYPPYLCPYPSCF